MLPVLFEGQVKGVLELASFERFSTAHQALLGQLAETIGIVINTIQANTRTEDLLKQSQSLAGELQSQQEELRQTNQQLEEKAALLAERNVEVERKNQEVEQARVALEEKARQLALTSKYKSEFLANMSHELRTPLNAVIGFSDVLLEQMFGELNERQGAYIRDIRDSGRHLLELINEILDLSRIEAGRMELEVAPLSLPDLMEHGLAMVRERAIQHRITLSLDVAPEAGVVWGDELKLKQLVLNLLTNAVKFTPDGGSVDAMATVEGAEARVTVRDTGIGIAGDEQERIFEAFQRGGRSPQASAEGTGLGLTLSKRIVELHGGRLWVTSRPGTGSTFGFAIPVDAVRRSIAARESSWKEQEEVRWRRIAETISGGEAAVISSQANRKESGVADHR